MTKKIEKNKKKTCFFFKGMLYYVYHILGRHGGMADAVDSKSTTPKVCGFESHCRYIKSSLTFTVRLLFGLYCNK